MSKKEKFKLCILAICFAWNYGWCKVHRRLWEKYCHIGLNADEGSFLNTVCGYGARFHVRRSRKLGNRALMFEKLITGERERVRQLESLRVREDYGSSLVY